MSEHSVSMQPSGPPRTVLPPESPAVVAALSAAAAAAIEERHDLVARVVMANPRSLHAWAALGDLGRDDIERYAAYRVGYHRGLDALRANGWRGSGYVRWADGTNRGFLRCLSGLQRMAAAIGEDDEAQRIAMFMQQLDPTGIPSELGNL
ncbi:MAG TPA: DUF3151 family protein [Ilumatobacteraceae bacterium]|nr:DUF3151 family protein [Ilumatobacteraceae bacterium]